MKICAMNEKNSFSTFLVDVKKNGVFDKKTNGWNINDKNAI